MRIDELIEKLENFKKEYGNLDVGIRRDKVDDFDFFADLTLIRLNKFPLFADKEARDRVECDYFLGIY